MVVLAAAVIAAAGVLFLYHDYRREAGNYRRIMVERGNLVLESLAAGTRAHCRMANCSIGMIRPDRLRVVFEELAGTAGVVGLALKAPDGSVIASGGDVSDMPPVTPGAPCWENCCLAMAASPDFTALGLAPGQDPADPDQAGGAEGSGVESSGARPAAGPYTLVAALDATDALHQMSREWTRFVVTSGLLAAAVGLGACVTAFWLERRRLEADLAVARERASQNERLAQLGAGLAHETKNPLGLVRGLAQAITQAPGENRAKQLAGDIVDETDRTVGQINSFLSMARPKDPELTDVDLDALLAELLPLVQPDADRAGAQIHRDPSGLRVKADRNLLRRAVLNLLLNSVRAVKAGGRIRLETTRSGASASLSIGDDGVGIAPADLPRVTEPYFSRFENGCGLGLAITEQIARAHGWRLHIDSAPGKGTTVTIHGLHRVP